ncbi:protein cereblon-like isoform X3 [Halichondria panicea]|uniref:protein cereblon-like isoform X3 n=1 Tax=Halichondria panicea TaxID=6063 RepID=UPI00312BCBE0
MDLMRQLFGRAGDSGESDEDQPVMEATGSSEEMKTHLLLEKALLVRLQLLILVGKAVERLTFLYLLSICTWERWRKRPQPIWRTRRPHQPCPFSVFQTECSSLKKHYPCISTTLIPSPQVIQMLRDASTRKKTVAVCTDLHLGDRLGGMRRPTQDELAALGTTAEIVAFREEESEYYYGPCFVVRLLGKQRFRLLKVDRRVNGLLEGHVKILPEIELPPHSSDVYACPAHIRDSCHAKQLIARTPGCSLHTRAQLELCINRLQSVRLSGSVCSVPTWVFRFYDTDHLREVLMKEQELKTFVKSDKASTRLPENIISLSYWLARRLPINEPSKLLLLSINCPTQRVIKGLQILKEFTKLHCSNCDTDLGLKEDIFSMSVDGPLAAYVNPGGYVHDTLTLTKAVHLNVQGGPSSDHSWFPGSRSSWQNHLFLEGLILYTLNYRSWKNLLEVLIPMDDCEL